jgi:ferredoxin
MACGDCKNACPVDAIVAGDSYAIDPDVCTECGACADVCPSSSIYALRPEPAEAVHHEFS